MPLTVSLGMVLDIKKFQQSNVILPISSVAEFWTRFKCQKCGGCCTGKTLPEGSKIKVSRGECRRLKLTKREHIEYPCKFYSNGCIVYEKRPVNCRAYPLAGGVVKRGQVYLMASPYCPAIKTLIEETI